MDYKNKVWACYIAAALLTLLSKFVRYAFFNTNKQRSKLELAAEWFAEATKENAASWVATVGVVWCFGYFLIEKTDLLAKIFGSWIEYFPISCPVAFLFGYVAEKATPDIAKWLVDKVSKPVL